MIAHLSPGLAERFGLTEVDVWRDDSGVWRVMGDGEDLAAGLTLDELDSLVCQVAPPERAPEPRKRGYRGERVSARRTGRYAAMMRR